MDPIQEYYNDLIKRGKFNANEYSLDEFRSWVNQDPSSIQQLYNDDIKDGLYSEKEYSLDAFKNYLGANTRTPLHDYFAKLESDNNYQAYNDDIGEQGLVGAYQIDYQINEKKIHAITGSNSRDEFYSDSYAQDKYMSHLIDQYQQHLPELQKINEERGLGLSDWELLFIQHEEGLVGTIKYLQTSKSMFGNDSRLKLKIQEGRAYLNPKSVQTQHIHTTFQPNNNDYLVTNIDNLARFPNNLIFNLSLLLTVIFITFKFGNYLNVKSRNYFINFLFILGILTLSLVLFGILASNITDIAHLFEHLIKIILYTGFAIFLSYKLIKKNTNNNASSSGNNLNLSFYFIKCIKFITFKSKYAQSIFNEGNRRLVFILSLVFPLFAGYIRVKENDSDYFDIELFWYTVFLAYGIFHIGIYIYKWIKEGYK